MFWISQRFCISDFGSRVWDVCFSFGSRVWVPEGFWKIYTNKTHTSLESDFRYTNKYPWEERDFRYTKKCFGYLNGSSFQILELGFGMSVSVLDLGFGFPTGFGSRVLFLDPPRVLDLLGVLRPRFGMFGFGGPFRTLRGIEPGTRRV